MRWLRWVPFGLSLAELIVDRLLPVARPTLSAKEREELARQARERLKGGGK